MRMKTFVIIGFLLAGFVLSALADNTRLVLTNGPAVQPAVPLSVDIDGLDYNPDRGEPVLYRLDKDSRYPVACQIEAGRTARLWFIPDKQIEPNEKMIFELVFDGKAGRGDKITARIDDTAIVLAAGDKKILRYYYATYPAPAGKNPLYQRSGFIHPLYSPGQAVLTQIQPADHYHHYGIWSPWTKTVVQGREVDFWNLAKGQGTVRFAGLLGAVSGPVYGGLRARQEHVDFTAPGGHKVAINETLDVRAFACRIENRPVWAIDFTSILHNATDELIELAQYRYGGGLGFRATENWNRGNCSVLTSEGKTRADASGSRARWCDIAGGDGKGGSCGVVFLSNRANREHPEPVYVWPVDTIKDKGDMFFEFCPIRLTGWQLRPGQEYTFRYRMIVYDGKINPETAEALWKNYTYPPVVAVKR